MTDAIAAGQQPAEGFEGMIRRVALPVYFYFVGWPYIKNNLLPSSWTGVEPPSETGIEGEVPAVEMEPVDPMQQWLRFGVKLIGFIAFFVLMSLFMIYAKQESILYVPTSPIQFVA